MRSVCCHGTCCSHKGRTTMAEGLVADCSEVRRWCQRASSQQLVRDAAKLAHRTNHNFAVYGSVNRASKNRGQVDRFGRELGCQLTTAPFVGHSPSPCWEFLLTVAMPAPKVPYRHHPFQWPRPSPIR